MHNELLRYFRQTMKSGASIEDAKSVLLVSGWAPKDIEEAMKMVQDPNPTRPSVKGMSNTALIAVAIAGALVMIGAGTFFVFQTMSRRLSGAPSPAPQAVGTLGTVPTPLPVRQPSPMPTDTQKDIIWIPFTFTFAGFSLEYPAGWSFYMENAGAFLELNNRMVVLQKMSDTTDDSLMEKESISMKWNLGEGETAREVVEKIGNDFLRVISEGPTTFGKQPGYFMKGVNADGVSSQAIGAVYDGMGYTVEITAPTMNDPIIQDIISRFTILESKPGEPSAGAQLRDARMKARDAKRISDIKQLETVAELYFNDFMRYPAGTGLIMGSPPARCVDKQGFRSGGCDGIIYMGTVPKNPTPGGSDYVYTRVSDVSFNLVFVLEGDAGNLKAGIQCATENGIGSGTCAEVRKKYAPAAPPSLYYNFER